MGNIIQNEQFKNGLQQLLQNKKFKRTLKIIYKEKKSQLLSVQSCQIFDNDLTIKQLLEHKERMPIVFEHYCKIILDVGEKQRYFNSCILCSKKMKWDRNLDFCLKCDQKTQYKRAYCLIVKIIDIISKENQDTYKAIIFDEAINYLGIQANDFSNMSFDSQNNQLKKINEQKSNIVYLLKLEYNPKKKINYIIKEILPQTTH